MPLSLNPFGQVQQEVSLRFNELQVFWTSIKTWSVPPPGPQPFDFEVGKGMTIVYCYAALEFSLTRATSQLCQLINTLSVRAKDLDTNIKCLAHEPRVQAILDGSKKKAVSPRVDLFKQADSINPIAIGDNLLQPQLQNVWAQSVLNVFDAFGIIKPAFNDLASTKWIDRIVDDRNAIAHGRSPPESVGQRYTIGEVDSIISRVTNETSYMISVFSEYYLDKSFIAKAWRHRY